MGALTIGFMQTEEVKITGVQFTAENEVIISVVNQGTSGVTISEVSINGQAYPAAIYFPETSGLVVANGQATATVSSFEWGLGSNYQVKIQTTKGNVFMYNAVA